MRGLVAPFQGLWYWATRTQGDASLCPGLICYAPSGRFDANISRDVSRTRLAMYWVDGTHPGRRFAPCLLSHMPNGHEHISPGQGKESVAIFDAALGAYPHKNKSPERAKPGALDWTCVALLRPFRACGIGQRAPRAALRSALGWYVMPLRGDLMRTFHGRGWRCFGSMVRTQGGASLCPGLVCYAPSGRFDANISRDVSRTRLAMYWVDGTHPGRRFALPWAGMLCPFGAF